MVNTFEPTGIGPSAEGRARGTDFPIEPADEGVAMTAAPTVYAADVLVIGWGLAGLVAAVRGCRGRQAGDHRRPGAAHEPRRAGVVVVRRAVPRRLPRAAPHGHQGLPRARPPGLARQRRRSTATRTSGRKRWAEAYLQFAAGEKRAWLRSLDVGFFPVVGWAERGGYTAIGPGNSVPRFHITWGTGPGLVAPFQAILERGGGARAGCTILPRHRVDDAA